MTCNKLQRLELNDCSEDGFMGNRDKQELAVVLQAKLPHCKLVTVEEKIRNLFDMMFNGLRT